MADKPSFPKYKCHKVVGALKIAEVQVHEEGYAELVPESEGYPAVVVPRSFVQKHQPAPGGYLVEYEDGYQSFSPAGVFEAGYTLIEPKSSDKGKKPKE